MIDEIQRHLAELDQELLSERKRIATMPPAPMALPPASMGHHTGSAAPVYPDPKPVPKLPFAVAFALGALAVFGVASVLALVVLVVML